MSEKWAAFWNGLPPVVRTLVHVAVGAAAAYAAAALAGFASNGEFDVNAFAVGLLTAIFTAVAKALNPADPAYGIGSGGSD